MFTTAGQSGSDQPEGGFPGLIGLGLGFALLWAFLLGGVLDRLARPGEPFALDRFTAAAKAGFKGVEYLFPYDYGAGELKQRLNDNGLEQVLHNLPAGDWAAGDRGIACLPDRVSEFREGVARAVEYATALGCRQLNCLAGKVSNGHDPQELRSRGFFFLTGDPGSRTLGYLASTLWALGYPEQALRRSQESLALARELSHPFTQATALVFANYVRRERGESLAALEGAEALVALSNEHGFLQFVGLGTFHRSLALADQGQLQEGVAGMRGILEATRAAGSFWDCRGT